MKKIFQLLLVCLLIPAVAQAKTWDEEEYKRIEQSIQAPVIPQADFLITKYGAKPTNTAAQNQN